MKVKYEGLMARLVWDGGDEVRIPPEAGEPREDQMLGTAAERLGEVSGRACYDSMGRNESRSSADYHPHIVGVGHSSVYGHWHGTFEVPFGAKDVEGRFALMKALINRPGIYVNLANDDALRFTTNFRALTEFPKWTKKYVESRYYGRELVRNAATALMVGLYRQGDRLAPQIMKALKKHGRIDETPCPSGFSDFVDGMRQAEPEDDFERWITVYMEASRGLTHEEVRHGYATGISQRSTRFVDEDASPYVMHPLLQEFLVDEEVPLAEREEARQQACAAEAAGKNAYATIVTRLQPWCMKRIPTTDKYRKTTARKQARGAGRGYLGNGLRTLGTFSASVDEWLWKLGQRAANAADGEIRCEYAMEILPELRKSRYASRFSHLETEPAGDGVGLVLKGGGNK